MEKDFDRWSEIKKNIESIVREKIPKFDQRDIWWCSLGLNIGYEEDGKNKRFERPVLILKKFNKEFFIGLPLTSKIKNNPYYFPYSIHGKKGSVVISQSRFLSAKRLNRKLIKMGRESFEQITIKYIKLFE